MGLQNSISPVRIGSSPPPLAKFCIKCSTEKPIDEFNRNARSRDGHFAYCKPCYRDVKRPDYHRHKASYLERNKAYRLTAQQFVMEYLRTHPCVDCGESDPIVLTFDHVRGTKRANLAKMVSNGYIVASITAEIAKCEVRCANCHMRRTSKQLGWYKYLGVEPKLAMEPVC